MGALVLGRFAGEKIKITVPPSDSPTDIWIEAARFLRDFRSYSSDFKEPKVRLAFIADKDVEIFREEVVLKRGGEPCPFSMSSESTS